MIVLMKCLDEEFAVRRVISNFHDEPWCDRIIVIDGGSTDYTVMELKQFAKVEVFIHPWLDWYHDMEVCQSNVALSYVPNNALALIVDFDEVLNDTLKDLLVKIDREGMEYDVAHIARKTYDLIRHDDSPFAVLDDDGFPIKSHQIGQFPDYQCRLIKKNPKIHWINSPHHLICGHESAANLPEDAYIIHYEKDDLRQRERIEKKWLRAQARRKQLGLTADVFETDVKPELAEFADPERWK